MWNNQDDRIVSRIIYDIYKNQDEYIYLILIL